MASPLSALGLTEVEGSKPRRPCDACRKRKTRCVVNDGAKLCVLCEFHHQECTFLQTPLPRKRKLNESEPEEKLTRRRQSSSRSPEAEPRFRKLSQPATTPSNRPNKPAVKDYAELRGPSLLKKTLGLQSHRHSRHVGLTTELDGDVLRLSPFNRRDEGSFARNTLRKVSDRDIFIMQTDDSTPNYQDEIDDLDAIEAVVAPHGIALINLYFRIVHPSFPILHKRVYLEKYGRSHREFSPPLLAAVYILALSWWSYSSDLGDLPKPDVKMLERLALKTISHAIQRPKLSTVQAGLLLLQRPDNVSWSLTAQIIVIGQVLGLHLDCSNWKIPLWEQGLRRRLAWGLYMQDKWSSLIYGRPSQIHESNWGVKLVSEADFPENAADEDEEEGSTEVEKGMILFTHMIGLTRILSEILDAFYSLRAITEAEKEGSNETQFLLAKAKPIQIQLREWFTSLPDCLRLDSTKVMKLSSTGYLHLAYFATEITLHRCIIRSLKSNTDVTLRQICRAAAKVRLQSAIDFVYRLRPEHLQSFWYFASKINLAIFGSFGSLLWATAEGKEEAEFYKARLGEYKWTLRVSSKGVEFMEFALSIIDASIALLTEQWDRPGRDTPMHVEQFTPIDTRQEDLESLAPDDQTSESVESNSEFHLHDAFLDQDDNAPHYRMLDNPAAVVFSHPPLGASYDSTPGTYASTLEFHALPAPSVHTSPSDMTPVDEIHEADMAYYGSLEGQHETFGFMSDHGQWMDNTIH